VKGGPIGSKLIFCSFLSTPRGKYSSNSASSNPLGSVQMENEMAPLAVNRKRKQTVNEQSDANDAAEHFPDDGGLDLLSDDEEEDGPSQGSDSDEIDAFPEIDAGSDTEEEGESPGEDEEDDYNSEDEQDDEDASSDNGLHIFPKVKTIISDITGHLKKVYPEIEPDYDSDSSTEDVRVFIMYVCYD
jgi:hypothetical protein